MESNYLVRLEKKGSAPFMYQLAAESTSSAIEAAGNGMDMLGYSRFELWYLPTMKEICSSEN